MKVVMMTRGVVFRAVFCPQFLSDDEVVVVPELVN
jgi:hypothetical protein